MTLKHARKLGYEVVRGSYQGTTDDHLDRWYVHRSGQVRDRRGEGFRTRRDALETLEAFLDSQE